MLSAVSTSPLSSASAASRVKRRDPNIEPDNEWKENLKAQIQLNLTSMVEDTESQFAENLKKNPEDRERLQREHAVAMENIRKLATETFRVELERERNQRRWAFGDELPADLAETMKKEQQAIWDQIQGGKSPHGDGSTSDSPVEIEASPNLSNRRSPASVPSDLICRVGTYI
ncbi:hypothetical protein GYMLUDRAFT_543359 [Collybiopsis luxurians FD-317 M1]|nr:hypothetical protein GYMLUDRAFT_543359 [Collybiopsis luxurians FD-317 M1]